MSRLSLLIVAIVALVARPTIAADLITATISITNNPVGNTNTLTVNGSTRAWTNNIAASPGTLIQQTNSPSWAASNLINHLTAYPVSFAHFLAQPQVTNVIIRGGPGENLSVSQAGGWASVTMSTQSIGSPTFTVRVPITVETPANRTNIASLLVAALVNSTNALGTNWTAGSNYLTRGASPLQHIAGPVQFNGVLRAPGSVALTNGFTSALTNINPVTINLVNYGAAIRSEGTGGNSFQAGSNALAGGLFSLAVGNDSLASSNLTTAIGINSAATNDAATAIGPFSHAGAQSVAIGYAAGAPAAQAVSIGSTAVEGQQAIGMGAAGLVRGKYTIGIGFDIQFLDYADQIGIGRSVNIGAIGAMGIGPLATSSYSNSAAIGPTDHLGNWTEATATNQIRLGTGNHTLSVPGIITAPTTANLLATGTNRLNGDLSTLPHTISSIAAGNNAGVLVTNVLQRITGSPAGAWNLNGIAGGRDGRLLTLYNDTSQIMTLVNESGVDPVAANRIDTLIGTDITTGSRSVVQLFYDGNRSRWIVMTFHP